jgi:hypothetical protein
MLPRRGAAALVDAAVPMLKIERQLKIPRKFHVYLPH